jgi:hypothetical protein
MSIPRVIIQGTETAGAPVREIRFLQCSPGSDRRHFVDEDDVRVVLSRLPPETYGRLTAVRFDDRGGARRLGYVERGRREVNLCAQPPRSSLSCSPAQTCARSRTMSFRRYSSLARDETQPLGRRYMCVRRAGELYAWLTQTSFESVFIHLGDRHGFRVGSPNTSETISAAAAALEASRDDFLRHLDAYRRARRLEKRRGRRSPTPAARDDLHRDPRLGVPLSWQPRQPTLPATAGQQPFQRASGLPPPELEVGDRVSVNVGGRNRTPHTGHVRAHIWHLKLERWCYYLQVNERKIHKRYFADDLSPIDSTG